MENVLLKKRVNLMSLNQIETADLRRNVLPTQVEVVAVLRRERLKKIDESTQTTEIKSMRDWMKENRHNVEASSNSTIQFVSVRKSSLYATQHSFASLC